MHILSPETDNCPSWISGRERMTVENISWWISTKECCRPRRGLNPRPPGLQSDGASNWATEAGCFSMGTCCGYLKARHFWWVPTNMFSWRSKKKKKKKPEIMWDKTLWITLLSGHMMQVYKYIYKCHIYKVSLTYLIYYQRYFRYEKKLLQNNYSGTSIIQSPRDQTVLFELSRLWIIEG